MTQAEDPHRIDWATLTPTEYTGRHVRPRRPSLDEASSARTEILRELRSERLIGSSKPLYDWNASYLDNDKLKLEPKSTHGYYRAQNDIVERLTEIDNMLDAGINMSLIEEYGDDIGVEQPRQRRPIPQTINIQNAKRHQEGNSPANVKFWVNINLAANILLMAGKCVVFLLTASLSVVASLVDSVLDLMSTIIIFISSRMADRRDWKTKHLYPVGRSRLEPIGVLVFSVVMVVSFLKVADESLETLVDGFKNSADQIAVNIGFASLVIMLLTVVVKVVLWFCCKNVNSSSVQALAQDAETDIVFNVFSIIFPLVGHYFDVWWMDPMGALLLSVYVVHSWGSTAMEHIENLSGSAASPEDRRQLLYMCMRFSSKIIYITALNAYHAGDKLMCEVDIVLEETLSFRDSHDLAESLQYALETLPIVERAFVHIEYRRENFTGHVER